MSLLGYFFAALAAVAAGLVNALAGGGTLMTFPTLTAIGLSAVAANVTNTVGLFPGFIGGLIAQWKDLQGQNRRIWLVVPSGIIGGVIGGFLLLHSGEKLFRQLVPWLILFASVLLAAQDPVRAWLVKRAKDKGAPAHEGNSVIPLGLAAIYGGYFGAGISVIALAVLGLTMDDTLTRLNALKQVFSLSANLAAAIYFLFSGQVQWLVALVMAGGALLGGNLGGRLDGRVQPATLRWIVVTIGIVVAIIYFVRG
jgi:uncharacterized protein